MYYSTKLTDAVSYPKQVQAKHTYGYNREVAALESELIGYRTYGGFFLDFMGRSAGRLAFIMTWPATFRSTGISARNEMCSTSAKRSGWEEPSCGEMERFGNRR